VLGVDGISDFNALHSGKHNDEVKWTPDFGPDPTRANRRLIVATEHCWWRISLLSAYSSFRF
jgi:hypothetical protein